jgi:hypothetical protein
MFVNVLLTLESTGYPPRSKVADWMTPEPSVFTSFRLKFDIEPSEYVFVLVPYYISFFVACIYKLMDRWSKEASLVPEKWIGEQMGQADGFWNSVMEIHCKVLAVCFGDAILNEKNPYKYSHRPYICAARILHSAYHDFNQLLLTRGDHTNHYLFFFFDEARPYLNLIDPSSTESTHQQYLHYMRLAMSFIPRLPKSRLKVAMSFLDTFGSIANYAPTTLPDPSLRFIKARKIFSPLTRFGFQRTDQLPFPTDLPSTVANLFGRGRYLWQIYENDIHSLFQVARYKLLMSETFDPKNEYQCLALLGSRAAMTFLGAEKISLDMVRSHAATLFSVSPDRSRVFIGYPSEPVLPAVAATITINRQDHWVDLLYVLERSVLSGLVEAGQRGELAARLVLLMAVDRARVDSTTND